MPLHGLTLSLAWGEQAAKRVDQGPGQGCRTSCQPSLPAPYAAAPAMGNDKLPAVPGTVGFIKKASWEYIFQPLLQLQAKLGAGSWVLTRAQMQPCIILLVCGVPRLCWYGQPRLRL